MIGIVDIHCHLIYGVDDGARTIKESKKMLDIAYAEGIRTIIATPHFRRGMFECSMGKIKEHYEKVRELAATIGEGIEVLLGCEYYANMDMVDNLKDGKRPTMADSTYVLTEFSTVVEFPQMRAIVYDLICNGYNPILAHIERYNCLKDKIEYVEELANLGAMTQVNADSVIGGSGWKIKRFCKALMKRGLLDFVGTDGHGSKGRTVKIAKCASYMARKMGDDYARKILIDNPREIIAE